MPDKAKLNLSWLFVMLVAIAGFTVFYGDLPVSASDNHDDVREMRDSGDIIPLSDLLDRKELSGMRVLEAELEREDGQLVYELELLDQDGRVYERYYDAATGQPLKGGGED